MAKRKKQTENQKAYQKERRRLLQAVRMAEKQGYIFPEDIVPKLPKRVTKKRLEEIQKTKPKQLYKKAIFVYPETGVVVPAEQRKQEVKQEVIKKSKETRKRKKKISISSVPTYYPTISIIDTIRDRISELTREAKPTMPIENRKNELLAIFDDTVTMFGDNRIDYFNRIVFASIISKKNIHIRIQNQLLYIFIVKSFCFVITRNDNGYFLHKQ